MIIKYKLIYIYNKMVFESTFLIMKHFEYLKKNQHTNIKKQESKKNTKTKKQVQFIDEKIEYKDIYK